GDLAAVVSRRGTTTARVRCVASLRPDTVFRPFHFGGAGSANNVTNPALDPVSRMPEFKVAAVRLEPASTDRNPSDGSGTGTATELSPTGAGRSAR
uniref:molybdopterin dinucleotide binding domain-containing protein n=1 Tax=Acuticoccus kandeliae TaxID=2073160 RepID=UPI00196AF85B